MSDSKIVVELHKSSLSTISGKYTGTVLGSGSLTNEGIAAQIAEERTDLRPETIKLVLELADTVKVNALLAGKTIVDGVGYFHTICNGSFDGDRASFDADVHSLSVAFAPCSTLRTGYTDVDVVTRPGSTGTSIFTVHDGVTDSDNSILTSGGIVYVTGQQIRIIGNNAGNGVYFVAEDGTEYSPVVITTNEPTSLIMQLPTMATGEYTLKIVTQCGSNGRAMQTVNTCEFDTTLSVQ